MSLRVFYKLNDYMILSIKSWPSDLCGKNSHMFLLCIKVPPMDSLACLHRRKMLVSLASVIARRNTPLLLHGVWVVAGTALNTPQCLTSLKEHLAGSIPRVCSSLPLQNPVLLLRTSLQHLLHGGGCRDSPHSLRCGCGSWWWGSAEQGWAGALLTQVLNQTGE